MAKLKNNINNSALAYQIVHFPAHDRALTQTLKYKRKSQNDMQLSGYNF